MTITVLPALPPAPARGEGSADFSDDADAFADALGPWGVILNAITAQIDALAVQVTAAAQVAINAPNLVASSTTSLAIGTGAKAAQIQSGKSFTQANWVIFASQSDPTNWMVGPVASYNGTTLTMNAQYVGGSGTKTDWVIGITPPETVAAASVLEVLAGLSNNVALTPANLFGAAAPVALTDAASIAPNLATGMNFTVTLGGNRTLANPTNMKPGQSGIIAIAQDTTGGRTLTLGTAWKIAGGNLTLSTSAGTWDLLSYFVLNSSTVLCSLGKAFS